MSPGPDLFARMEHNFANISNDKLRFSPYTVATMPNGSPLTIETLPGKTPGSVILRLTGPIVLASILLLRAQFRGLESPQLTILDMSGVPYVDSAGMSEIISHHIYCRDRQVRLVVAGVTPRVMSMLQVTRLDHVLNLAETVEEAEALA